MSPPFEAFFLPVSGPAGPGERLCLHHPHAGAQARGAVVYAHPLGDEMNKSRRMAALQARALAAAGFDVLQIDLTGCGDSSGDFESATWDAWIDDLLAGCRWLRARCDAPLWLWGLRAGALLTSAVAGHLDQPPGQLWWQPPPQGKALVHQLLRLKAAEGLGSGGAKVDVVQLRRRLEQGERLTVAGYTIAPELLRGLETATLAPPRAGSRLLWLEVTPRAGATLLPASQTLVDRWKAEGAQVDSAVVEGPQFWQTTEVEQAPTLLEATVRLLGATA